MIANAVRRAACYIRMSSDKQERSPAQQRAEIKRLAEREGCEIVREFKDEGITGDSGPERRPEFKAMLAAAEAGEFSILLLYDQDRLGRFDSLDGAEYFNRLRRCRVKIVTCTEGPIDLDTFEGRVIHTVKQEGRHAYLLDLSKKVVRGKIAAAKDGSWNGGRAHYGLERALVDADGLVVRVLAAGEEVRLAGCRVHLVPGRDKGKLAAVRWAFERLDAAALSLRALAEELATKGYPVPPGGRWTHHNVGRMLRCRAYLGTTRWGSLATGRYFNAQAEQIVPAGNGKNKYVPKPDEQTITIEGTHQAIIDPKVFERVQRKIGGKDRRRCAGKGAFPLTGIMVCAHCGKAMVGETFRGKDRKGRLAYTYPKYVCSTYSHLGAGSSQNKTGCRRHAVDAAKVLRWVVAALQEEFLGPGRDEIVLGVTADLRARTATVGDDTGRLTARLAELDQEVGRLVKAVRTTDMPELVQELQAARLERDQIKAELERAGRITSRQDIDAEAARIADTLAALGARLVKATPATLREVLALVVEKIECRWEPIPGGRRQKCRMVGGEVTLADFGCLSDDGAHAWSCAYCSPRAAWSMDSTACATGSGPCRWTNSAMFWPSTNSITR